MLHGQVRADAAARRLPPSALAELRQAFAGELAGRLASLRDAVGTGDDVRLREAVRDAHSLASSAAVVGEADAARTARAAEVLLSERPDGAPPSRQLVRTVEHLAALLSGWRP